MDWKEIKNKDTAELREVLVTKRGELLEMRFQTHSLKQVHKIKEARRAVARITALLEERKKETNKQ